MVDEQANILAVTAIALEYGNYRVTTASSGEVAIERRVRKILIW